MKFAHVNIVANDVQKLADFYVRVFHCQQRGSISDLTGSWVAQGTGVENAEIKSIVLNLPGFETNGPTLEIFQYNSILENPQSEIANKRGLGHLAFEVEDVESILKDALANGAKQIGELAIKEFTKGTLNFIYIADPEGNIIEIMNWKAKD